MRVRAKHYATGERIDVVAEGGRIVSMGPPLKCPADRESDWISPPLFDLQINGCLGHSFNSPDLTVDQVRDVVNVCRCHGIGGLLPTLITNSFVALHHGFATLRKACETDPAVANAVPGFHLEGPYIASDDGPRGAHPKLHVRRPDWDEFQRWQSAAGGRIRLVTLAPEHDGALAFIERLAKAGIVVAIGHTAASGQRIREAIAAGASLSTHLGNGSHAMLPRHENYFWELAGRRRTVGQLDSGWPITCRQRSSNPSFGSSRPRGRSSPVTPAASRVCLSADIRNGALNSRCCLAVR